MAAKVVMYSKTTCPYCHRAESLLRERGVTDNDLDLIQIDIDRSRRDEMIKRARRSTVPQIFIDGEHVGGCDDLVALDRAGGLVPLLKAS
jgi:glutaredoxin 3